MTVRRFAVIPLLVLAACGGGSEPARVRAGGTELVVSVEPTEPRVGRNTLWIELRDAEGAPQPGAELDLRVHMAAMGAMPAMGGPVPVEEAGGGRYRADFEVAMGGTWLVELSARLPDGATVQAEGSLTTGTSGLRLERSGETAGAGHPGEFRMDPHRLQRVGVRTAPAELRRLETDIRAVGRVVVEETTLADVALKVRGWAGRVEVDALGDPVEAGQVLFHVYSPELYSAQEEYLQALRSQARARGTGVPDRADYLVRAARRRLALWDIATRDLERLAARGAPLEELPIRAPVSGYVVEKAIVEGSAFAAGERLYRIAPLARVWVEADVYEYELPLVHAGQTARVTLPYLPGRSFEATVGYLYPTLDAATRTGRLRLELPNPDLALRPDMYANVRLRVDRGERLLVPQSAVLQAGERSFVFRDLGEGRLRPVAVEVGLRSGDDVEILEGLEPGDRIVTSGTFLVASESRLRAALEQW